MAQENVMSGDPTFCLAIPHTPWIVARVKSLQRLLEQLGSRPEHYREFSDREPNWSWAGKMWEWAAETGATYFLQLQDDVIASPNFWSSIAAMVRSVPDQIIGLESVHPEAHSTRARGDCWYTTSDGLIGVGYVVPAALLRRFLYWRSSRLCKGAIVSISEDTLLCTYALAEGYRIWHPVPTIIDHDTEIASTYGNDHHSHRRPTVTWRDFGANVWPVGNVAHVGHFYGGRVAKLARRWVIGATDDDLDRWRAC
jgi:hypothetical protein